ncbi:MAG TPA: hypothetical protein VHT75_00770 [Acidimicrobiales bacterium]|jgi:hypothetical protein|nr:hypothetical protein [Acidimicrobiales bacterium]
MGTDRRSFVVHVYADGLCTVEDVRSGAAVALNGLGAVSDRIAVWLTAGGDGGPALAPRPPGDAV